MISKKRKRKKKTQYLFLKNRLLSRMGMKLGEKKIYARLRVFSKINELILPCTYFQYKFAM